jgi:hypothetical protein
VSTPATKEMSDWLGQLGMSEYAQRFAENGIDISVLGDLTDQDLKDIGVLLGHRRKMLRAIGELTSAAPLTTEPAVGTEPKPQDTAERYYNQQNQLTTDGPKDCELNIFQSYIENPPGTIGVGRSAGSILSARDPRGFRGLNHLCIGNGVPTARPEAPAYDQRWRSLGTFRRGEARKRADDATPASALPR